MKKTDINTIWIFILFSWIFSLTIIFLMVNDYTSSMLKELNSQNESLTKMIEWQDNTISEMDMEMNIYSGLIVDGLNE